MKKMHMKFRVGRLPLFVLFVMLIGCSGPIVPMQLIHSGSAMVGYLGYQTAIHKELVALPPPDQKVAVAVYKFRDQTGQFKAHATVSLFSTAVTQGATSMITKALEDAGNGGWFTVIEREGLPNLLNERKIIRSTRRQFKGQQAQPLPPLLFAGILLEGGVIAYESNIVTGGFGARFFALGGNAQFRRDAVTVYLRAVSVKNGRVLKSVQTSKTILSKEVDAGIFRFVRIQRLLEIETGLSTNEPPQMAVLEAIEKAVHTMILEGVKDKLWAFADEKVGGAILRRYLADAEGAMKRVEFDEQGRLVAVKDVEKKQE